MSTNVVSTQHLASVPVNRETQFSPRPKPEVANFPFSLLVSPRSQHLARAKPNVSSVRWHQSRRLTAFQRNFHLIISELSFHVEAVEP